MEDRNRTNKTSYNLVFLVSAVITLGIVLWGIISNDSFSKSADRLMQGLEEHFSWLYLGVMLFFVLFCFVLAVSKFGTIRLGADDEKPEYSTVSWFAMLFAAGMGIGLVFWGVAEPLSHYVTPMKGIEQQTAEAAAFSMRSCIMHYGLQPWACYAVMGLGLAYFQFRKKEPALVSNIFQSILGTRNTKGIPGKMIDIYTTVLTVIGVATSFGMGCLQICGGLEYLFQISNNVKTWMIVIGTICVIYLFSAVSGIGKGVKILSNINLCLLVFLAVVIFAFGPTKEIVLYFINGMKDYIVYFIPDSLRMSSQGDRSWINSWRVFYWAWWLSWSPFVGLFIARISRGRTIREFVAGAILIPTLVSAVWFCTLGGLSIQTAGNFTTEQLKEMAAVPQTALFHIFDEYSFGMILSLIAIVLLIIFFITSADSATFVLAMLTSDGDLEPENGKKIFWGISIAVAALVLILSGSISVIQTVSIVIAFPYIFLLLLLCVSVVLELKKDLKAKK